ncbi:hypothetical protein BASA81_000426 [Batrachochytrium salamandrivorans]|nr:hypothetical protein BASA81_000426 [Batrachochytrium salamandrivorans]
MQARQRLVRPGRSMGEGAGGGGSRFGIRSSSKSGEEGEEAGKGLVYLLFLVAVSVVVLIAYRSFQSPPRINYNFWSDSEGDIKPVNTLRENEQVRVSVEADLVIDPLPANKTLEALSEEASEEVGGDEDEGEDEDQLSRSEKEQELRGKATLEDAGATTARRVPALGNFLFSDADEFESAPLIKPETLGQGAFPGMWKLLLSHEEYFSRHEHRRYIPRLAQTISRREFHEVFRKTSTPVVIPFEFARKLGFVTEASSIKELQTRFPYDPSMAESKPVTYSKYSLTKSNPDWGPAVYAISLDAKLEKIAVGVRNFPRNLHMSSRNLAAMGVSRPPYIQKHRFQPASAWFGTSTSDTKFHHDCCDNFVMMIVGTKRWFIAPPVDWRKLKPVKCEGDNQSLCWASVPYPNAPANSNEQRVLDSLNSITIDIKAGEMLYLPAGWWHHITNLGPTIMMNHWTFGCENVAMQLELEPTRKDRPDFKTCERNAKEERAWRQRMDEEDAL